VRKIAFSLTFILFLIGIILSGCKSTTEVVPTLEVAKSYSIKEANLPKYLELVQSNRLSLKDAIQLAKGKNLSSLLSNLEEQISEEKSTGEQAKSLAKIILTYDFISDSQKANNTFEPEKISSLLNFSLAYFNAKQPSNLALKEQKLLERATQNLVTKVVAAYFDVALAQRNVIVFNKLFEQSSQYNNSKNPESLVRLKVLKQHLLNMVAIFRQKSDALANFIGFENPDELSVDDLFLTNVVNFNLPNLTLLEQMALILRPELNELTLSKQLQLSQCRKAIDDLFSEVRISYENNEDWNRNFYINSFVELAYKSAYKLLLLADNKQKNTLKQFSLAEIKLYTPAIAVISHVRIAQILWDNLNREYKTNNQKFQSLKDKAKVLLIVNKSSDNSDLAQLDNTLLQLATLESKCIESMAKLYSTYYLMLSTVGIDNLDSRTFAQLQKVVKQKSREAALFFTKENSPKEKNSSSSTKQSTNQVNTFSDVDFLNIYQ
jgi:hypothetical protein